MGWNLTTTTTTTVAVAAANVDVDAANAVLATASLEQSICMPKNEPLRIS